MQDSCYLIRNVSWKYKGRLKGSWTGGSAPPLCQVVVVGVT